MLRRELKDGIIVGADVPYSSVIKENGKSKLWYYLLDYVDLIVVREVEVVVGSGIRHDTCK